MSAQCSFREQVVCSERVRPGMDPKHPHPRDTVVPRGNGGEPDAMMPETTNGVRCLAMDDAGSRGAPRAASARFTRDTVEETATVVNVDGELDINSADALREALDAAEADGCSVLRVDAASVTFLDSTALGVILASAQRMAERGGRFELVCGSPSIRRILDMTMISRTVHLLP
jgi:anti-sigma B factor antagonist